jgi:hypothetical protein
MMTFAQLLALIEANLTRVGSNRIKGPKIKEVALAIANYFASQIVDALPDWTDALNFNADGTGAGAHCKFPDNTGKKRLFESKTNGNVNHQPPSDPSITENDYWKEVSPASGSAIKEWVAGLYGPGVVIVVHNHSTTGRGFYWLLEPIRPFNSTDIEVETIAGKWERISGGGGGPVDLEDGQGTTVNGSAIDIGGTFNIDILIAGFGGKKFDITSESVSGKSAINISDLLSSINNVSADELRSEFVVDSNGPRVVDEVNQKGIKAEPGSTDNLTNDDVEYFATVGLLNNTIDTAKNEIPLSTVLSYDNEAGNQQIKDLANPTDAQDADTKGAREAAINALATQLIDGATDNTLKKLQDKITAINAIIGGSTADGDSVVNTVAELLAVFATYTEGVDIATLLSGKVNTSDVYNALDQLIAGKVLDARQGKVLKDLIDTNTAAISANTTAIAGKVNTSDKADQTSAETVSDATLGNRNDVKWMTARAFRWAFDKMLTVVVNISAAWTALTAARGTNTTQIATTAFVQQEIDDVVVDDGTIASGTYTINLSRRQHEVVLTGNITLDYSNLVGGKECKVWIERSSNTTITLAANRWSAALKTAPVITDPTQNGSSPAKAIDLFTIIARKSTDRPTIVITPDIQNL